MGSLEATIIALVMLIGVFVLVGVALFKGGVESAIKLWGVMGALTGVGFGAITSFYFTDTVNRRQIKAVTEQKEAVQAEKKNTVTGVDVISKKNKEAQQANLDLAQILKEIKGKIPPKKQTEIDEQLSIASKKRVEIENITEKVQKDDTIDPNNSYESAKPENPNVSIKEE